MPSKHAVILLYNQSITKAEMDAVVKFLDAAGIKAHAVQFSNNTPPVLQAIQVETLNAD